MAANVKIYVDPSVEESIPDSLTSEQLQIEAGPSKYVRPGRQTKIKLTIRNFSSVGRMAQISVQFDGNKLAVDVPINHVYVAPQGTTATYAIVRTYAAVGSHNICFSVN